MAKSLKMTNPKVKFVVCLAERKIPDFAKDFEFFDEVVLAKDLGFENFDKYIFKHSIVEASTSVKGQLFKYLFKKYETESKFVYLDPDIEVFSELRELDTLLNEKSIVLIPHITAPEDSIEAVIDNELCALRHGTYNLGFLAVRNDTEGNKFINWWTDRLRMFCYDNIPMGIFTDQRWVDLAPSFFDVFVLKHPGYDIAPWNISHRKITETNEDIYLVNGEPLRFFHFSGFDSGANEAMVKKYVPNKKDPIYKIRKEYIAELDMAGQVEYGKYPWDYAYFTSGEKISDKIRLIYRSDEKLQEKINFPFNVSSGVITSFSENIDSSGVYSAISSNFEDENLREHLGRLEREIQYFKNSKFWKARNIYLKLKFVVLSPRKFIKKYYSKAKYLFFSYHSFFKQEGFIKANHRLSNYVRHGKGFLEKTTGMDNIYSNKSLSEAVGYLNIVLRKNSHFGEALKVASEKNEEYDDSIEKQISSDSSRKIRDLLRMIISANGAKKGHPILFFDHEIGGGTNLFRENFIKENISLGKKIILATYNMSEGIYHLRYCEDRAVFEFVFNDLSELRDLLKLIKIDRIVLSSIVSFPDPFQLLKLANEMKEVSEINLEILMHDYFCVCPNFVLVNQDDKFCGLPDLKECATCIKDNQGDFRLFTKERDVKSWRQHWQKTLKLANQVICFSNSSKSILKSAYPELNDNNIKVRPHKVEYIETLQKKKGINKKNIIIGVPGRISHVKGASVIQEVLKIIEREKLNIIIVIIGEYSSPFESKNLIVHGAYERKRLPKLAQRYEVDIFFIPSICPETFSYTTEEIMQMDYPLAVFDLGAPAERVKSYKKGVIIPRIDAREALESIIRISKDKSQWE
ncbi:MAG: glycosyltransferase [Parcubacteria group bacterium]